MATSLIGRAGDREGVGRGAGAAAAAADEGDLHGIIFGGVDEGNIDARECGDGGGGFEKLTTGGGGREGVFHGKRGNGASGPDGRVNAGGAGS